MKISFSLLTILTIIKKDTLMILPIKKQRSQGYKYDVIFQYLYATQKCEDCIQYYYVIKNSGNTTAKNIKIFTYSDLKIKDVLLQDNKIQIDRGTNNYADTGQTLKVDLLKPNETVIFGFSSKQKSEITYDCYVEDSKDYCFTALIDLAVTKLDDSIKEFEFLLQNYTIEIPILTPENSCYVLNMKNKKWGKLSCINLFRKFD